MERQIYKNLIDWKSDTKRKPLLLRGARQVGKTYIVRKLGESFPSFLEVNFEMEPEIKSFFKDNLSPEALCTKLSTYYNTQIVQGKTLLFFDEIQACPQAIQALRFFYEKMPGLHVIAAGSLLEFALGELSSFGVGRIQSLFMYPLSFNEFLMAMNKNSLVNIIETASPDHPIDDVFHNQLKDLMVKFILVGGMPEAVSIFSKTSDILKTQKVLDDIANSLEDDFVKYKSRINSTRIKDVYVSVINQTGSKYNIVKSSESGNHEQKKEALEMLVMAGLCYKVYHTSANGIPLASEKNLRKFKVVFFDTGILQRAMNLQIADFFIAENLNQLNKGNIAEQFVGLEIVKNCFQQSRPELYYWHREKKGSNAEVDYIFEKDGKIIPIEVKSGMQGKMQSLFLFLELKNQKSGVRVSMENFSKYENIQVFPLYAISNFVKKSI